MGTLENCVTDNTLTLAKISDILTRAQARRIMQILFRGASVLSDHSAGVENYADIVQGHLVQGYQCLSYIS